MDEIACSREEEGGDGERERADGLVEHSAINLDDFCRRRDGDDIHDSNVGHEVTI